MQLLLELGPVEIRDSVVEYMKQLSHYYLWMRIDWSRIKWGLVLRFQHDSRYKGSTQGADRHYRKGRVQVLQCGSWFQTLPTNVAMQHGVSYKPTNNVFLLAGR